MYSGHAPRISARRRPTTPLGVFATAHPIETTPAPGSTRHADDHTVVSVGPYMFQTAATRRSSSSARSRDSASPPHSTFRPGFPPQPDSSNRRQVAGVACITVAPDDDNRLISRSPSSASSRLASTTLAPLIKGRYSSSAAMSNDSVVTD